MAALLRSFPERLSEPAFWMIQGTVVGVTGLHATLEATGFWERRSGVLETLPHTPMILLIVPITFAGFRYGLEGGLLTGLWAAMLTVPNLALWHSMSYAWVGELSYMLVIAAVGVLVSVPVDRERRQRLRAEATGRRLALLNEVTSTLAAAADLPGSLRRIAPRLVDVLGLDGLSIAIDDEPMLTVTAGRLPGEDWHSGIGVEGIAIGSLTVAFHRERPLVAEDLDLLRAIAAQVGVAVNAARLREQEHDRLRSYVHHVTRAQEAERKRIARELHDGPAQSLVLLCREMDALARNGHSREALQEGIVGMRPLAEETLASVRRYGRDLRPPILDDLGLAPAVESLAAEMTERTGIGVSMKVGGTHQRLPSEVELTLYRITQEALRNVEKHAAATDVRVMLRYGPGEVSLCVTDDGAGFRPDPPNTSVRAGRLGLIGMRERAQLIGATFTLHPVPGEGTTIRVDARVRPGASHHPPSQEDRS